MRYRPLIAKSSRNPSVHGSNFWILLLLGSDSDTDFRIWSLTCSYHPKVLEALNEFWLGDSNRPYAVCGVRGGEKEPGAEPPTQPLMYRFDFTAELRLPPCKSYSPGRPSTSLDMKPSAKQAPCGSTGNVGITAV